MDVPVIVEGKVDWRGRPARKYEHGGSYASYFILVLIVFENYATLALALNLVTYFNQVMHFDIATASTMLTNFLGTSFILAVAIACLADGYIGRHKVAIISGFIEFMGIGLLAFQAHRRKLRPPPCNVFDPTSHCERIEGGNSAILYIALYSIALGMAGLKASAPAHGADQFDETDPLEAPKISSFFNWLLLATCIGGSLSMTLGAWIEQNAGWDWAFGACAIAILLGVLVFAAGVSTYRIQVIGETNPITEIMQVYVASIRNRKLKFPENPRDLYEIKQDKEAQMEVETLPKDFLYHIFRFLDKAAVQPTVSPGPRPAFKPRPWKLCTVTQVDDAKTILAMLPIFASSIIMNTCMAQLQTFSIHQGSTMDTALTDGIKIPPASLPIIPIAFMIVLIPIYDRVLVPLARKYTGHTTGITHLQRVGVGLVLSCASMAAAAMVEVKRKNVARSHGMLDAIPVLQPLPISTFWLVIQYFIFGIADIFTFVGLLEFFYSEAPMRLKSTGTSFVWCSVAFGYFFSTMLVNLVNAATKDITSSRGWLAGNNINRNFLNNFYWLLAMLSFINFLNYLFWARRYRYKSETAAVANEKV